METQQSIPIQPRVSVIVPAWNARANLDRCLQALTAQTLREIEIIVVDDGSTDGTWDALLAWQARDPRILPLRQANSGVSAARNAGLRGAHGEWIRFVDVDDSMQPDSLEILLARAEQSGADLVIGGFTEVRGPLRRSRNLLNRADAVDCDTFVRMLSATPNAFFFGVVWNKLFRRSLLEEAACRFEEQYTWGEDFAFMCDYLPLAECVAMTDQSVYEYYLSPTGLTWRMALQCVCHPVQKIRLKLELYHRYQRMLARRPGATPHTPLRYLWGTTLGE